jgi:hypothetical protein
MLMADGARMRISAQEADTLVADLNRHFAELGLRFEAPSPQHWYVFSAQERVRTTPLSRVRGRSVTGRLPEGPDGVAWNSILAELQMLLHDHEINRQRADRGLPRVNSVWFWGGGRMPALPESDWTRVWSDETLPMALASAVGVARSDRPADGREWLQRAEPGRHLLLLDELAGQLPDIPQGAWAEVMARMEAAWWGPLFEALRRGRLDSLHLYPLNGQVYAIDRKAARSWWRRPRPWPRLLDAADYGQTD